MAETPFISDILASNPTLDVNATRFSVFDTANLNRVVAHFSRCIPFYKLDGQGVEVRGHDPASPGPSASFYDELTAGRPDIPAETLTSSPRRPRGPARLARFSSSTSHPPSTSETSQQTCFPSSTTIRSSRVRDCDTRFGISGTNRQSWAVARRPASSMGSTG